MPDQRVCNWGRLLPIRDYVADAVFKHSEQTGIVWQKTGAGDHARYEAMDPTTGAEVRIIIQLIEEGNDD